MPKAKQTVNNPRKQLERSHERLAKALGDLKHQPSPKEFYDDLDAKEICTKDEYEFYRSCQPESLRKLGIVLLRQKVNDAVNLRDTYEALARNSRADSDDIQASAMKTRMLAEALARVKNELNSRSESE